MTFRRHAFNDDLLPTRDVCGELLHLAPERTADIARLLAEDWYPRSLHTEEHLRGYQPQLIAACRHIAQTQATQGPDRDDPAIDLLDAIDHLLATSDGHTVDAGTWSGLATSVAPIRHAAATRVLSRMTMRGDGRYYQANVGADAHLVLQQRGTAWAVRPPEDDEPIDDVVHILNTWSLVACGDVPTVDGRVPSTAQHGISVAVRRGFEHGHPPTDMALAEMDRWGYLDPMILAQAGQPFIDHAVDHLTTYGAHWLAVAHRGVQPAGGCG